jgi:hypothetical protein
VIAYGSGNMAWGALIAEVGVKATHSPAEGRAYLAAGGVERDLGSELKVAAWLFPERLPGLLSAGADLKYSHALHWAAAANSVEGVTLLLAAGMDVDSRSFWALWAECVSIKDPDALR